MTAERAVNPMTVQRTNETVRYMQSGHHETKQCIFLILILSGTNTFLDFKICYVVPEFE